MAFFTLSIGGILFRFAQLIAAPFVNPAVLWFALPLLITLIAVELYYGRYKEEKMSWNAAMMNALVLVFVALNTAQFVFMQATSFWAKIFSAHFLVALLVFIIGLVLFFGDFFHKLPKNIALSMTIYLPINLLSYTSLVIVYNKIPFDLMTIIAYLVLFLLFAVLFFFIRKIEPPGKNDGNKSSSKSKDKDFDFSKMDFGTGKFKF